jgi:hypothetical protein
VYAERGGVPLSETPGIKNFSFSGAKTLFRVLANQG